MSFRQLRRVAAELQHLVVRSRIRETHHSFATLGSPERWGLVADLLGAAGRRFQTPGEWVGRLEASVAEVLGLQHSATFGSGRAALRAILEGLDVRGAEVLVPGFTCVVVPLAIRDAGATPVYVDIGEDYRFDLDRLRGAVTGAARAVLLQHPYGIPERVEEIVPFAREAGLAVVEDCAHVTFGATAHGRCLGGFGDASFFSFELTKPVSSGWGGVAVTDDPNLAAKLRAKRDAIGGRVGVSQNIRVGIQLLIAATLYHPHLFGFSRLPLALLYRLGILPISIPSTERAGVPAPVFARSLLDIQARLLLRQLERLEAIREQRATIVARYARRLGGTSIDQPLLRYPLQLSDRNAAVRLFRRHQIELGQWFQAPLHPADSDFDAVGYSRGRCPTAEAISRRCVNLPTLVSRAEADRIIDIAGQCQNT